MEGVFETLEPAQSESPLASSREDGETVALERKSLHEGLSYGMDEVFPGLFIGGDVSAGDLALLQYHSITHVLNAAQQDCSNYFPSHFSYLSLHLKDANSESIESFFYEAAQFIDSALTEGGKVLIHCEMGMSRSVTLGIAYVILKTGRSFEEVLEEFKAKREICAPNMGFQKQLEDWCQRLYGEFPFPRVYAASTHHPKRYNKAVLRLIRDLTGMRLDPRGLFLIHTRDKLYVWTGTDLNPVAHPLYLAATRDYISNLQQYEGASDEVVEILQGAEPEGFWDQLYGFAAGSDDACRIEATWDRWYAIHTPPASSNTTECDRGGLCVFVYPEVVCVFHIDELADTSLVAICEDEKMSIWIGRNFEADTFSDEEYIDIIKRQNSPSEVTIVERAQQGSESSQLLALLAKVTAKT